MAIQRHGDYSQSTCRRSHGTVETRRPPRGRRYVPYRDTDITRLTDLCPGLPGVSRYRKGKTNLDFTVSGSGISGAICKSEPRSSQITTPAPYHAKNQLDPCSHFAVQWKNKPPLDSLLLSQQQFRQKLSSNHTHRSYSVQHQLGFRTQCTGWVKKVSC